MSLTTAQLAREVGVPAPTIRKWVERGKVTPVRRGTRPLLFDEAQVEALQQARWRDEQHRIGSRLGDACAEYDALVAAQVNRVSRSVVAELSPQGG